MNLTTINHQLRNSHPAEIFDWVNCSGKRVIATTSFGFNAAVMLRLIHEHAPDMPIVWVDSGYNVRSAYQVAEELINTLNLNMRIYTPQMTAERRNALMGGIPDIKDEMYNEFVYQVKLEPFQRAVKELEPEVWLTGIRHKETEHRKTLDIISIDKRRLIKVAPIFYWDDRKINDFMSKHRLPSCTHYFDPTKVANHTECGLHTSC